MELKWQESISGSIKPAPCYIQRFIKINVLHLGSGFAKVVDTVKSIFGFLHVKMCIMSATIHKIGSNTEGYSGPERRFGADRRVMPDRRETVRFDHNGGDRRSGFARRDTDLGFREQDFPGPEPESFI